MTKIVIGPYGFRGELPRAASTLLPNGNAQVADNCNVTKGSLKSYRKANAVAALVLTGTVGTVYLYRKNDGTQLWLEFTQDVDVQPGPIAGDITKRTYYTGTDRPRVFDDTMVAVGAGTTYPKSNFRMGVPRPALAPTVALGGGGSGSARSINYVETFVRKWASGAVDEGQPSPVSSTLSALPGQTVNLSALNAAPSAEYGVTHRRIYRINTGITGAEYQYVTELAIATTTYADAALDAALGEVIPSEEWAEPPTDLKGLISLPNGCFAGFFGNQIAISYPFQVHAWPTRYQVALPYEVVGIGFVGTTIIAATNGRAYLIDAQDPEVLSLLKVPPVFPCLSKRGVVSTEDGVTYPTHDGLAIVRPSGESNLLTRSIVDREGWETYYPSTLKACDYRNSYFAALNNEGDADDVSNDGFLLNHAELESGIVNLFGGMHCVHVDDVGGGLYYVGTSSMDGLNYVYKWDSLVERVEYLWRSKAFVLPNDVNFGAARILGRWTNALTQAEIDAYNAARNAIIAANQAALATSDVGSINASAFNEEEINGDDLQEVPPALDAIVGMTFKLYYDGVLAFTRTVENDSVFRLPTGKLGKQVEVELQGQIEAYEVRLGTSVSEIADA